MSAGGGTAAVGGNSAAGGDIASAVVAVVDVGCAASGGIVDRRVTAPFQSEQKASESCVGTVVLLRVKHIRFVWTSRIYMSMTQSYILV